MARTISALRCVRPTSYLLIAACLAGCGVAMAQAVSQDAIAVVDPTLTTLVSSGGPWAVLVVLMMRGLPIIDGAADLVTRAVATAERISTEGLHIHHHIDADDKPGQ